MRGLKCSFAYYASRSISLQSDKRDGKRKTVFLSGIRIFAGWEHGLAIALPA
jgi:hypothetical protein